MDSLAFRHLKNSISTGLRLGSRWWALFTTLPKPLSRLKGDTRRLAPHSQPSRRFWRRGSVPSALSVLILTFCRKPWHSVPPLQILGVLVPPPPLFTHMVDKVSWNLVLPMHFPITCVLPSLFNSAPSVRHHSTFISSPFLPFASCITRVQLYVNVCNWMAAICAAAIGSRLLPINCHFRDCKAHWSVNRVSCAALYKNPTFTLPAPFPFSHFPLSSIPPLFPHPTPHISLYPFFVSFLGNSLKSGYSDFFLFVVLK